MLWRLKVPHCVANFGISSGCPRFTLLTPFALVESKTKVSGMKRERDEMEKENIPNKRQRITQEPLNGEHVRFLPLPRIISIAQGDFSID
jgi:hypothetical protein